MTEFDGCLVRVGGRDWIGVGAGVDCWLDDAVLVARFASWSSAGRGSWSVGIGPVYGVPSSPGAKVSAEQKPSEEETRTVRPSGDLCSVSGYPDRKLTRDLPGNISKWSVVQVVDDTERGFLLCVIKEQGILRGHGVDNPIR